MSLSAKKLPFNAEAFLCSDVQGYRVERGLEESDIQEAYGAVKLRELAAHVVVFRENTG